MELYLSQEEYETANPMRLQSLLDSFRETLNAEGLALDVVVLPVKLRNAQEKALF